MLRLNPEKSMVALFPLVPVKVPGMNYTNSISSIFRCLNATRALFRKSVPVMLMDGGRLELVSGMRK